MFQDLRFDISFVDALLLMPRFAPTIKSLLMNKEKLLGLAKIPLNENCSADAHKMLEMLVISGQGEVLRNIAMIFNSSGGNPPTSEPFTSEFILEEIEAYLKDDSISPEIDHDDAIWKEEDFV
ncbi:hypothetical protein Tco_0623311 [Tanacetum coccineum]